MNRATLVELLKTGDLEVGFGSFCRRFFFIAAIPMIVGCVISNDVRSNADDPPGGDSFWGDGKVGDTGPMSDFPIRVPEARSVPIVGGVGTEVVLDWDHVCRIDDGELQTDIYIQASGSYIDFEHGGQVIMEVVGAWCTHDDGVVPMPATYDLGGNHLVDRIQFELDGGVYVIWHSSFTATGRTCAPPDCVLSCQSDATFATCDPYGGFLVDGCDRETGSGPPPIPVICVLVNADGTVPPLLDPWQMQTADPDYPILPCPNEIAW